LKLPIAQQLYIIFIVQPADRYVDCKNYSHTTSMTWPRGGASLVIDSRDRP